MKLIKPFNERLPKSKHIRNLFAVIVCLIYSWTLITSFYKLPSWLFYLNIGQVASIYAYSFVVDLVESILFTTLILFLGLIPFFILRDKDIFQSRSVIAAVILLGSSMLRLVLFKDNENPGAFADWQLIWWGCTFLLAIFLAAITPKIKWLKNILEGFPERAVVFLYIYLPLSALSFIVVIFRNTF